MFAKSFHAIIIVYEHAEGSGTIWKMISMNIPVGVSDFVEIRRNGYYYIDKTKLIEQLLDNQGKVNLFTRPRRFGKTLNMSMLKYFFEIGTNCALFDGLYISRNQTLCREHMAGYPVIFITLKNVDGLSFEEAKCQFMDVIGSEASRFRFLLDSQNLAPEDKEQYQAIITMDERTCAVTFTENFVRASE